MAPPYEHPGADIAFWTLFGLFALGEFAIRFRSRFNRSGTRAERWSLLVVIAAVVGGMLAGIALANRDVGSIVSARWPLFVVGLVLMAVGSHAIAGTEHLLLARLASRRTASLEGCWMR
jgi:hypothetical protein